MKTINILRK